MRDREERRAKVKGISSCDVENCESPEVDAREIGSKFSVLYRDMYSAIFPSLL